MAKSKDYKNYLRRCRYRKPEVRNKIYEYNKKWFEEHKEQMVESRNRYIEEHKGEIIRRVANYNNRSCRDPILGDVCRYNTLIARKRYHPDLYEGVVVSKCLIKSNILGLDEKDKEKYGISDLTQ